MRNIFFLLLLALVTGCDTPAGEPFSFPLKDTAACARIGEIPVPAGFTRITAEEGSFGGWLRTVPLRKDKTVRLYNGMAKPNQSGQFAVIDIPIGTKDLLQCADAVMRLRAEYLYAQKKYAAIAFKDYADKWYRWTGTANRPAFDTYLENIFGKCGSASLEKQLKPTDNFNDIKAGDVLVQGGFPGHAMLVMDAAADKSGTKIFILAQGYMPAQDIHVVRNPLNNLLSPWYEVNNADTIFTPGWRFTRSHLRKWE